MRNFEALMSLNPTQEPEVQMCLTPRYHAPSIQRLLKLYFAPLSRVPRPRLCVIIQVSILESWSQKAAEIFPSGNNLPLIQAEAG